MRHLAVFIFCCTFSACFAYRPFVVKKEPTADPPGEVSVAVSAAPSQAVADGQQAITLTLVARLGEEALVGAPLSVLVGGSGNTLSNDSVETDADGVATVQVRSTKAEVKTVLVTYADQTYVGGDVVFVPGPAASGTLTCARDILRADGNIFTVNGTTPATCTIAARDAQGNGVAGVSFALTLSGTGNTLPASVQTNAAGTADILISSTIVERKTLTATTAGVTVSKALRFVGQWYDANGPFANGVSFLPAQPDHVWLSGIRSMSLLDLNTNALEDFSEGIPLDANGGAALVVPDGADTRLFFSLSNGPTLSRLAIGDSRFSEVVTPTFYEPQAAEDASHVWLISSAPGTTNGSAPVVVFASRQGNGTWLNATRIGGLPDGYYVRQIVRTSAGHVFALLSSTVSSLSHVYRWNGTTWVSFSAGECTSGYANLALNNSSVPSVLYLACVKPGALRIFKSPSDSLAWTEDANFSDSVFLATLQNVPPALSSVSAQIPGNLNGTMVVTIGNGTDYSAYSRELPSGAFSLIGGVGFGAVTFVPRSTGARTAILSGKGVEVVSPEGTTPLFDALVGQLGGIARTSDGTVFLRSSSNLYRMPEEGRAIVDFTPSPSTEILAMAVDGNDVYLATAAAGVFRRRSGVWSACSAGLSPMGMPTQFAPVGQMIVADVPGEGRRVIAVSTILGGSPLDGVYFMDPSANSCSWIKKTNGQAPTFNIASPAFAQGKLYVIGQNFDNPPSLVYVYENGAWTSVDPIEGDRIYALAAAPDGKLFLQYSSGALLRYETLASAPTPVLIAGDIVPPLVAELSFDGGDMYASVSGTNRVIGYRLSANQVAAAAPRLQALTLDGSTSVNTTYGRAFTRIGERLYAIVNTPGSLVASVSDGN